MVHIFVTAFRSTLLRLWCWIPLLFSSCSSVRFQTFHEKKRISFITIDYFLIPGNNQQHLPDKDVSK